MEDTFEIVPVCLHATDPGALLEEIELLCDSAFRFEPGSFSSQFLLMLADCREQYLRATKGIEVDPDFGVPEEFREDIRRWQLN